MRKVVIACDSYKGCLSSAEVAKAAAAAVSELYPECEVVTTSVADGGEGTVEALVGSLGGHMATATVSDPLGRPTKASYGVAGDLAIIESASACGLTLLSPEERNPLLASTRGLGELIVAAFDAGCRRFLIGLGGSATNDGGMGMISTPGLMDKVAGLPFTVACDVDTPYIGPAGASRVFGPQKGASAADVEILEQRLTEYSVRIFEDTGVDVRDMPGAGAAGGLGGAFAAYLRAELRRGVNIVLDQLGFDEMISGADLVITGEGCSDYQTLKGKVASGILARASRQGIPVALMSGAIKDGDLLRAAGFASLIAVSPAEMPLSEAMDPDTARHNIQNAIRNHFSQVCTSFRDLA